MSGGRGGVGGGFGRGSGGRDRSIIHKTVRVIKGPFKGRVLSTIVVFTCKCVHYP